MSRILIEIPEEDFSVEEIRSNSQAVCQRLHENEMGYTYLSVAISDRQLSEIMAAPERYAVIPIWVKWEEKHNE